MAISKPFNTLDNFDIPRTLTTWLKIKIFFNSPSALLGLCFFFFGGIFPFVFGPETDFKSAFSFKENDPATNGIIVDKIKTGNSENKRKIYEYVYDYTLTGKKYTGRSFSTQSVPLTGDPVTVQYVASQPGLSRIQGMRAAPFSFFIFPFVCLFPVIGFIFILISVKQYKKINYLLQNGVLTTGKVTRKEPTSARVNKQIVYKVFFQFKSQDGNLQEAFVKTHKTKNLGDESQEPLVYDAQDPSKAVLLDALPKTVRPLLVGY